MPGPGQKNKPSGGLPSQMMLVRVAWSFADAKLLLWLLLLLFSLFLLFPLLPLLSGFLPPSDLRSCLSGLSYSAPAPPAEKEQVAFPAASMAAENYHPVKEESPEVLTGGAGVVRRTFNAVGSAAYLFIQMGAYRGGPDTFAVVGLASKPLHVFGKPTFFCEWIPHGGSDAAISGVSGDVILPDWGYGRVYTAVVVNCTFRSPVGADGSGGRLVLSASTNGGGGDRSANATERIEALVEPAGKINASSPPWAAPPEHEYLYCGSPLYGSLSPQRVREWLAYHAMFFGGRRRAHFVLYDAGGVHAGVMEVLRPWMEKGIVTLHDIREQERFDGYYHNQFLVVNDCLHRHRFAARWIFYFDLDEFIYLPPPATLPSLLAEVSGAAQFTIEQMPMSGKICHSSDAGKISRMWGMEKLIYRDVKRGVRRDRKYAVRPSAAMAAGVHMSQNVAGGSLHRTRGRIKYFHYHGTIADRREPCKEFANASQIAVDGTPFVLDRTLRAAAAAVKRFELKSIGHRLSRTAQ